MATENANTNADATRSTEFNLMQRVKRKLFALRNGALAAQMRQGGVNYRINFGLNLPQVKEVAAEIMEELPDSDSRKALAMALWANVNTRESRLLAPMIFPVEALTDDMATRWLAEAQTPEVSDVLCHSLLRKMPHAKQVAFGILDCSTNEMQLYGALRLLMNLLVAGNATPAETRQKVAELAAGDSAMIQRLSARIMEECDFRQSEPER